MVNRPNSLNAFAFQFNIVMLARTDHAQVGESKAAIFVIKFQKREWRIPLLNTRAEYSGYHVSSSLNARGALCYMDQT